MTEIKTYALSKDVQLSHVAWIQPPGASRNPMLLDEFLVRKRIVNSREDVYDIFFPLHTFSLSYNPNIDFVAPRAIKFATELGEELPGWWRHVHEVDNISNFFLFRLVGHAHAEVLSHELPELLPLRSSVKLHEGGFTIRRLQNEGTI